MPDTYLSIPRPRFLEGSSFTATAYFRNGVAGEAPTTARYRIDGLTTCKVLQDWTALVVGESIAISVTATHNAIQDQSNREERKQLTVAADYGTATETRDTIAWTVGNIRGF